MMITVEEAPAPRAARSARSSRFDSLPIVSLRLPPRDEVDHQASVEGDDRDDLLEGDDDRVVQHRHEGRLPLQVLGDVGILDLVKCHHLQSHLLVQNDVVGKDHFAEGPLAKGGWGQLVVAD